MYSYKTPFIQKFEIDGNKIVRNEKARIKKQFKESKLIENGIDEELVKNYLQLSQVLFL